MKLFRFLGLGLSLITAAHAIEAGGGVLNPSSGLGDWKPLVDSLAARGAVAAQFTESRYFPFHRGPTVLHGILRMSPEHGLSLEYTSPDHYVLIADMNGILVKEADGRTREAPAGSHESDAVTALLPIMRFDLAALSTSFAIHGYRAGAHWTLTFTPRDPGVADTLGEISVGGDGTEVRHLEFKRSSSQRVEIDVGLASTGAVFSPLELRRYFR